MVKEKVPALPKMRCEEWRGRTEHKGHQYETVVWVQSASNFWFCILLQHPGYNEILDQGTAKSVSGAKRKLKKAWRNLWKM